MPMEKKENAFSLFLSDKTKKAKKNVPMEELVQKYYREWKMLPEASKAKYKERAAKMSGVIEKLDSRGIPVSELNMEEVAKEEKFAVALTKIGELVDSLIAESAIASHLFNVVCISHYVHHNDTYVPAEIGLCQFSIRQGIMSEFHRILPARLPLGVRFEAKVLSENTHNLPLDTPENQSYDPEEVIKDFDRFFSLKDTSEAPILFTENGYLESVESMLKELKLQRSYTIFPLESLLHRIYARCVEDLPEWLISEILQSSRFDYIPTMACLWHQKVAPDAVKFCALSCVRRWIFNFFQTIQLKEIFAVSPTHGKHFPSSQPDMDLCKNMKALSVGLVEETLAPTKKKKENIKQSKMELTGAWPFGPPQSFVDTKSTDEFPSLWGSQTSVKKPTEEFPSLSAPRNRSAPAAKIHTKTPMNKEKEKQTNQQLSGKRQRKKGKYKPIEL